MMAARRFLGLFLLLLIVIVALLILWYIGGQKTVYSLMLPARW